MAENSCWISALARLARGGGVLTVVLAIVVLHQVTSFYSEWHNFLGNKSMVEALLSRLRHYCHTVRIDGPSLREPQA